MIDTPRIIAIEAQTTAVIHLTVSRDEIQSVMGPGISEVMATVAAQGLKPTGAWFTYHFRRPTDVFDFEVGVPIPTPVSPTGRVRPGQLPAARVVRTIYHGGYEGLGEGWGELEAWLEANGHQPAAELWEHYAVGPESSPDPATWRTELNRPLLR
jgi:effector-binding domain-containing protein